MENLSKPIPIFGTPKKPSLRQQVKALKKELSIARYAADMTAQAYAWKDANKGAMDIRKGTEGFQVFCDGPADSNGARTPEAVCSPCRTAAEAIVMVFLAKRKQQEDEQIAALDKEATPE